MQRVVISVGLIFIIVGISKSMIGTIQKKRCTVETVGRVIRIIEDVSRDSDGNKKSLYYPVIEYKVGDRMISKKSSTGASTSKYHVNDNIEILYNPNNIDEYIIKGDKNKGLLGIIFAVLGLVAVIVGVHVKNLMNNKFNIMEGQNEQIYKYNKG